MPQLLPCTLAPSAPNPIAQAFQDKSQTSCLLTPTYFRRRLWKKGDSYFIPYLTELTVSWYQLLPGPWKRALVATAFFPVDLSEPG